jgi:hypothetical protein
MTVASLLGHQPRGVTQRYVHLDTALQMAADKTATCLATLLESVETVVALGARRA